MITMQKEQVDLQQATHAVSQFLDAFNLDEGDHTINTPQRVAKAWQERLSGYKEEPRNHLSVTFSAPEEPGLIIVRNVQIQSTCAHHLLPITGTATIAYHPKPGSRVVGLSKLSRLAEGYARRLQVQENITAQITNALWEVLEPQWAACAIEAEHGCMKLRGVKDSCSDTLTFNEKGISTPNDIQAFWYH